MSDRTGESVNGIKVVLTDHALRRLHERFFIRDRSQIEPVFERAVVEGLLSSNSKISDERLIEYGCLVIAGDSDGNGTFTVSTVFNLTNDISEGLKDRMRNGKATPWESSQVVLLRKRQGDSNE